MDLFLPAKDVRCHAAGHAVLIVAHFDLCHFRPTHYRLPPDNDRQIEEVWFQRGDQLPPRNATSLPSCSPAVRKIRDDLNEYLLFESRIDDQLDVLFRWVLRSWRASLAHLGLVPGNGSFRSDNRRVLRSRSHALFGEDSFFYALSLNRELIYFLHSDSHIHSDSTSTEGRSLSTSLFGRPTEDHSFYHRNVAID